MDLRKTFKNIYSYIPLKRQIYSILKKVWVPPFYRHLHFKGLIQVPITNNESFKIKHYGFVVENEIFWKGLQGDWEKESVSLWIELCRMSNSILDIGANTGVYSLIAKAVNPNAKVFAFEPVHRVYEKLAENNRINNYDIVCNEVAASNYTGEATIYDTDTEHTYSVTVNVNRPTSELPTAPSKIKTITLDEYIQQNSINA
ncbi:MAG: FkbM family methyltransferase, partial [Flavisolibacter sp.]